MYRIQIFHDYIYKLIEALAFELPGVEYQIIDNTILTSDTQIVAIAEETFQFQPGLLQIGYAAPDMMNQDMQITEEDWANQNVFVM